MIKTHFALALALILLLAAGCDGLQGPNASPDGPAQATQTQDEPARATEEPTPEPSAEPTPDPNVVGPGCPTVEWALEETEILINVPALWDSDTKLMQIPSENPDIEKLYVVAFSPRDIELDQEANIGFICLIRASIWDAADGVVSDNPINEVGRSGEYVVGYTGFKDNPFIIDSPEDQLFSKLMLPTQGSAEVLGVK